MIFFGSSCTPQAAGRHGFRQGYFWKKSSDGKGRPRGATGYAGKGHNHLMERGFSSADITPSLSLSPPHTQASLTQPKLPAPEAFSWGQAVV